MQVESSPPQFPAPPGVIVMHTAHSTTYLPLRPSPLSPRSPNVPTARPFAASPFGFASAKPAGFQPRPQTVFAARFAAGQPPRQTHDAIRQRRRNAFLARIREARDDRRWADRRDEVRIPFPLPRRMTDLGSSGGWTTSTICTGGTWSSSAWRPRRRSTSTACSTTRWTSSSPPIGLRARTTTP
jgi:hypothetical protein